MGTSSGFEVDLNFTAVGGGGWDEWEGGEGGVKSFRTQMFTSCCQKNINISS